MLGDKEIKAEMVAPFSSIQLNTPDEQGNRTIKWKYVADFGDTIGWLTVTL